MIASPAADLKKSAFLFEETVSEDSITAETEGETSKLTFEVTNSEAQKSSDGSWYLVLRKDTFGSPYLRIKGSYAGERPEYTLSSSDPKVVAIEEGFETGLFFL